MPGLTHDEEDDSTATLIDPANPDTPADDEDNGNGPTAAELAAEEAERAAAAAKPRAAADADPGADAQVPRMIPKGRFDEVNEERKALAEQLAQATAALAALTAGTKTAPAKEPAADDPPAFNLKAAMRERLQALASGDDDRALELDEQIQEHTLQQAKAAARQELEASQATMTQQQQAAALKATAAEMKQLYPQLDEKGAEADQDAIDFVVARRDRLIAEGKPAHEALRQAVVVAAKRFGLDGDGTAPTKDDPAAARLLAARQRNAAAAAAQPPELGGKGNRATATARVDIEKMTDEEFAALPEAEKKRLRGDV
jgi:hypothetical protein